MLEHGQPAARGRPLVARGRRLAAAAALAMTATSLGYAMFGGAAYASASNAAGSTTPGLARLSGSTRTWYLTNVATGTGVTDQMVTWSGQLSGDVPLVGDWNGDGKDTPGIARFSGSTWTFYLTNRATGTGVTDQMVTWSGTLASDVPLVGDWNGDGKDTPGLARLSGSTRTWYLTNVATGTGVTDQAVTWSGQTSSDIPLAGDWNG
jgi:hypothetical protein